MRPPESYADHQTSSFQASPTRIEQDSYSAQTHGTGPLGALFHLRHLAILASVPALQDQDRRDAVSGLPRVANTLGQGHAENVTPLRSACKKAAVAAQRERPSPRSETRRATG